MNTDLPELVLPKDFPGQMEFEYPKKFKPQEMGAVAPDFLGRHIILNNFILSEQLHLGLWGMDADRQGKVSDVFCPFCQKGHLRIKGIKPIHSGGANIFGPKEYVGNEYELDCSDGCGATFSGCIQWMHVD